LGLERMQRAMDEAAINERLKSLIKEIAGLPQDQQAKLAPLVKETQERHDEISRNANKLEDSLQKLRILVQYVLFDLEATRREADALRKRIIDDVQQDDEEDTQT